MSARRTALATVALATLAAGGCGTPAEEPAPQVTPTGSEGPRKLVAEPLDLAALGPRIVGPRGPEVESAIPGLATLVSYVACPSSIEGEVCDPAQLPGGTVFTYVHTITLEKASEEQARNQWAGARFFRTTRPAPGFSLSIGYDRDQAIAALGEDYEIRTEIEDGALIWRVAAGDGWMPGETLTFYWRSSAPPAGPAEAYRLEAEGLEGLATGPFPDPEPAAGQESVDEAPSR